MGFQSENDWVFGGFFCFLVFFFTTNLSHFKGKSYAFLFICACTPRPAVVLETCRLTSGGSSGKQVVVVFHNSDVESPAWQEELYYFSKQVKCCKGRKQKQ